MADIEHIPGDWCAERGQLSGGVVGDARCALCGAAVVGRSDAQVGAATGGPEASLRFRSALLCPWLRGNLELADQQITGSVPKSILGIPAGRRRIRVDLDEIDGDLRVGRTRKTPVERVTPEGLEFVFVLLILVPVIPLVALYWVIFDGAVGWLSLLAVVVVVVNLAALHGWGLSGIKAKPIGISWADRVRARQFATAVRAAKTRSTGRSTLPK